MRLLIAQRADPLHVGQQERLGAAELLFADAELREPFGQLVGGMILRAGAQQGVIAGSWIDMSMLIALRRARNPKEPIANRRPDRTR